MFLKFFSYFFYKKDNTLACRWAKSTLCYFKRKLSRAYTSIPPNAHSHWLIQANEINLKGKKTKGGKYTRHDCESRQPQWDLYSTGTGVILLCNVVTNGVMADLTGVQMLWKVKNIHPWRHQVTFQWHPTWLGKTSARFKNICSLIQKGKKIKNNYCMQTWTMPSNQRHEPPPSRIDLNPANAHAFNRQAPKPFHSKPAASRAVYYKKASAELPPCGGVHVDCFSYLQHQGAPLVQLRLLSLHLHLHPVSKT